MSRFVRPSIGLIGQIVCILLLTMLIEFGVSVFLYERASRFSVRDDEAHRLAEHLVIARRLVAERPPSARADMAAELTTNRYALGWLPDDARTPMLSPALDDMRQQVLAWEPALARSDLRLQLTSPGRRSIITGALQLPDGSWLHFRTLEKFHNVDLAVGRILLALVPAIALMVLGGLLVRHALHPLRSLADAADRLGRADGEEEAVAEQGSGEIRRVIAAFNRMQARIHRLIGDRTHALAAVGHDLRTPLARLRLRAEDVDSDRLRRAIDSDVQEMEAMIGSLLAFLNGEDRTEPRTRVDLAALCATVADDAADLGQKVEYHGPDHCELRVRRGAIKRAVINLVENAYHHAAHVTLRLEQEEDTILLVIEDDGPGIAPERLAEVQEPFTRLDTARRRDTAGFGLGLSIVRRVAESEGGELRLENRRTGGLRAVIALPRP